MNARLYGFYLKIDKHWVRIGVQEFSKKQAVHIFQNALIGWCHFNAALRPIKSGERQVTLIALPAYGRDYTTSEAVLADWNAQKDFINHWPRTPGTYCNKQDLGDKHVVILFDRQYKAIYI